MTMSRGLRRRAKFSFRAFYLSTLIVCALALFTLGKSQYSLYTNGAQHGEMQRRAVAALDPHRLIKRDEEVCSTSPALSTYTNSCIVPISPLRRRQMRIHQSQLSRRRSRPPLLPLPLLLRLLARPTPRLHHPRPLDRPPLHHHRYRRLRLLLHKSKHDSYDPRNVREYGRSYVFGVWEW